jgi:hypothetical protein
LIKKIFVFLITYSFFLENCFSATCYVVKSGETLSHIGSFKMKRDRPLYGKGGRLEFLISINPLLKNPDLIKVGQCIFLSRQEDKSSQTITTKEDYYEEQSPILDEATEKLTSESKNTKIVPSSVAIEDSKLVTIDVAPVFSTRRIDAVEGGLNASALSDLGYGIRFGALFDWGKGISSKTSFTYEKYDFDVDSSKTVEDSKVSIFSFDNELMKRFGNFSHGLGFSYDRGLLLLAKDNSTLSFEKVDYLKAYYHIAYQLYRHKELAFSPYSYFKYHLSASATESAPSIKSGYELLPGYRISYEKPYGTFYLDMYYRLIKTEATNWNQEEKQIGLFFGLQRDF